MPASSITRRYDAADDLAVDAAAGWTPAPADPSSDSQESVRVVEPDTAEPAAPVADVSMSAVAAVTTSHIGRKLGFASTLTARAVAAGAIDGAAVAALGMFEQGFYDRFGFATASYDHRSSFDPQSLGVSHVPYRTPVRLGVDDAADMAGALRNRLRHHGGVTLDGDTWLDSYRPEDWEERSREARDPATTDGLDVVYLVLERVSRQDGPPG